MDMDSRLTPPVGDVGGIEERRMFAVDGPEQFGGWNPCVGHRELAAIERIACRNPIDQELDNQRRGKPGDGRQEVGRPWALGKDESERNPGPDQSRLAHPR